MRKFALTALLMSVLCGPFIQRAYGTDIPITPTGPVFKLLPAPTWGISGPTGFNNNFFFTPLSQNESVCVFVKNNNTTNSHTFTASISINSDPANTTPSDGTWQVGAASTGILAATSPGQPAGIGVSVSGAAQVSINFSASGTVAGAPETANVAVVQTTGNCFSGNQFIGSAPQTVNAVLPIQAISEGLSQGFGSSVDTIINPTALNSALILSANNGTRTLYPNDAIVSCSAACSVNIGTTVAQGVGCTPFGANNLKPSSTTTSTALVQAQCATSSPSNITIYSLFLAANTFAQINLQAFILPSGSLSGIVINVAPFTGTVTETVRWYEK